MGLPVLPFLLQVHSLNTRSSLTFFFCTPKKRNKKRAPLRLTAAEKHLSLYSLNGGGNELAFPFFSLPAIYSIRRPCGTGIFLRLRLRGAGWGYSACFDGSPYVAYISWLLVLCVLSFFVRPHILGTGSSRAAFFRAGA